MALPRLRRQDTAHGFTLQDQRPKRARRDALFGLGGTRQRSGFGPRRRREKPRAAQGRIGAVGSPAPASRLRRSRRSLRTTRFPNDASSGNAGTTADQGVTPPFPQEADPAPLRQPNRERGPSRRATASGATSASARTQAASAPAKARRPKPSWRRRRLEDAPRPQPRPRRGRDREGSSPGSGRRRGPPVAHANLHPRSGGSSRQSQAHPSLRFFKRAKPEGPAAFPSHREVGACASPAVACRSQDSKAIPAPRRGDCALPRLGHAKAAVDRSRCFRKTAIQGARARRCAARLRASHAR